MGSRLSSLERLEAQIHTLQEGTPQGAAWEAALVRWVNAGGHPDLVKGWGWKQWPGRAKANLPRIERGVDLIAEDRAGRLVAIQAKFRNDPDSPVKTGEVQKFVGAYRKHFPRRMLISNASSRARGIKEAVGDAEAELVLRTELMESLFDWVAAKPLPKPKVTPLPFQKEAATAIKKHLKDGGRAQIVMACGSGKTYTTLLAMEALGSKRVLVLAPTLLLVKQLRDEWMRERTNAWATLAVCSDIGADEGDDSTQLSPGEIGAKPTTDPAEIAQFLRSKGPYVVFGTYASSARIATAQKKAGVPAFDLVVADEAHRIAGAVGKADKEERAQRVVLNGYGIRAERRLFATATPRVYGGDKKRDGEEIVLESMDDPARFGEEVYRLTFQQAVDLERLVPYKLLVTIVTDEEIAALIHDRKYVDLQGKPIPADDLATAIAVRRAYKELGISRVISYHGNIKRARAFAQLVQEVKTSGKAPEAECVTGAMPVEDRKEALTRLAQADGPYLITNARCLTEGIDVPALDAVAFADPRRSQVDIVQAVGRAMRKPRGTSSKTTGYIILPVFLSKKELKDPETAVEGSAFAPVLQVLRALKAHDPYRATFFAKILVEQGKRPHKKGEGIDEILEVSIGKELDRALAKRLERAVQLRAVEVSAESFAVGFQYLSRYASREGNCLVPQSHIEDDYPLGRWVSHIRGRHGERSPEQLAMLGHLGFVWDALEENFQQGLTALTEWKARHGHLAVPRNQIVNGIKLALWISVRRRQYRQGVLSRDRIAALERIGFSWEPKDELWETGFRALEVFASREGHCLVPPNHIENGVQLTSWVYHQKALAAKGKIPPDKLARFTRIGFVQGSFIKHREDRALSALRSFKAREGHVKVPRAHLEDGFNLGTWLSSRRHQEYKTSPELKAALEAIGFSWNPYEDSFWETLNLVKEWISKRGSSLVPTAEVYRGVKIGMWLNNLRARFRDGELSADRIAAIEALGIPWSSTDAKWLKLVQALSTFRDREGHLRVPLDFTEQDLPIGRRLNYLRSAYRRGILTKKQIEDLDSLGVIWDPLEEQWRRGIEALKQFIKEHGHAQVPYDYEKDGFPLGVWRNARIGARRRGNLEKRKIQELDRLGFVWEVSAKGKRY